MPKNRRKISRYAEFLIYCQGCDKEIYTANPKHIFCSYVCRAIYIDKLRAREQKPTITEKRDLFGFAA